MKAKGKNKLEGERKTFQAMISIYCGAHHGPEGEICEACEGILSYVNQRLDLCPFGEHKPTCNQCTIHCYKPGMRDEVKAIMRFSGPKMMFKHPYRAIAHLVKEKQSARAKKQGKLKPRE